MDTADTLDGPCPVLDVLDHQYIATFGSDLRSAQLAMARSLGWDSQTSCSFSTPFSGLAEIKAPGSPSCRMRWLRDGRSWQRSRLAEEPVPRRGFVGSEHCTLPSIWNLAGGVRV